MHSQFSYAFFLKDHSIHVLEGQKMSLQIGQTRQVHVTTLVLIHSCLGSIHLHPLQPSKWGAHHDPILETPFLLCLRSSTREIHH